MDIPKTYQEAPNKPTVKELQEYVTYNSLHVISLIPHIFLSAYFTYFFSLKMLAFFILNCIHCNFTLSGGNGSDMIFHGLIFFYLVCG